MCMSDLVTCSFPVWTSSPSLPKRAVIYGSWALHSCVLWCLIQGPTTRQGGERGCVGNSWGLRSSGTLISYKYSLCCSHWSLSVWISSSYSTQDLKLCLRSLSSSTNVTDSTKSDWGIRSVEYIILRFTVSNTATLYWGLIDSGQIPVLSVLSSNGNYLVSDLQNSLQYFTLTTSNLQYIFLPLSCFISRPHSLFLLCQTHSEIYSSKEQLLQWSGVCNLWFNKSYISLAGVLYVPHPSPFGGFMEGLWIAGWFRSPLSCLRPVQATAHSPRRPACSAKCLSNGGPAGDTSAKVTQTSQ